MEEKANGRGRIGRKERDENGEGGRKVDAYKNPGVAYCFCVVTERGLGELAGRRRGRETEGWRGVGELR